MNRISTDEKNVRTIRTRSPEETFRLGKRMAEEARPGEVIALDGDLGSGKTVFAQGFAAGLGVTEAVTSPTFTIMQIYGEGRLPLYHFDVYRIEDPDEMDEIGYEEYFYGDGVTLVEWAEQIGDLIPPDSVRITIRRDESAAEDDARIIEIRNAPESGAHIKRK